MEEEEATDHVADDHMIVVAFTINLISQLKCILSLRCYTTHGNNSKNVILHLQKHRKLATKLKVDRKFYPMVVLRFGCTAVYSASF